MVPHPTTALTRPLLELERHILGSDAKMENRLRSQWQEHTPPFFSSLDWRNTGLDVRKGSLLPEIIEPTVLELSKGPPLTLGPLLNIRANDRRIDLEGFDTGCCMPDIHLGQDVPPKQFHACASLHAWPCLPLRSKSGVAHYRSKS